MPSATAFNENPGPRGPGEPPALLRCRLERGQRPPEPLRPLLVPATVFPIEVEPNCAGGAPGWLPAPRRSSAPGGPAIPPAIEWPAPRPRHLCRQRSDPSARPASRTKQAQACFRSSGPPGLTPAFSCEPPEGGPKARPEAARQLKRHVRPEVGPVRRPPNRLASARSATATCRHRPRSRGARTECCPTHAPSEAPPPKLVPVTCLGRQRRGAPRQGPVGRPQTCHQPPAFNENPGPRGPREPPALLRCRLERGQRPPEPLRPLLVPATLFPTEVEPNCVGGAPGWLRALRRSSAPGGPAIPPAIEWPAPRPRHLCRQRSDPSARPASRTTPAQACFRSSGPPGLTPAFSCRGPPPHAVGRSSALAAHATTARPQRQAGLGQLQRSVGPRGDPLVPRPGRPESASAGDRSLRSERRGPQ